MPNHPKTNHFNLLGMLLIFALGLGACAPAPSSGQATPSQSATLLPAATASPQPSASATPAVSPTASVSTTLRSFHMVNAAAGWGEGDGRALHTLDGGMTWQDATPPNIAIDPNATLQVFAYDAQNAWVLAPDAADFQKGILYRTSDGGDTWNAIPVPFSNGTVQFLSVHSSVLMADRGVAAGSQAVDIYRSDDGGATWTMISHVDPQQPETNGLPFGGDKSGVTFRDDAHGWLTGFSPMDGATYLYATGDGGKTWQPVQLALPAGSEKGQFGVEPPVFFNAQDGLLYLRASTNIGQQIFYRTQDGGNSWQYTTPLDAYGLVAYPEADHVIVWGGAALYTSLDDGETWSHLTPDLDLSQTLIALQFIDSTTGWALSSTGDTTRLYRTVDGGKTWH